MTVSTVKEEQKKHRMRPVIESSLRWNHLDRRFYQGLYAAFKEERYVQQYYRALHEAIGLRGRHCPHYQGKKRSSE